MVNQEIINKAEQYIQLVPADLQVKKSFLFGFFAKEAEREESDIDIDLILGNMTDFFLFNGNSGKSGGRLIFGSNPIRLEKQILILRIHWQLKFRIQG